MRIDQLFLNHLFVIIENTGKQWNSINLGHMTSSVQSEAYALQSSWRGQQQHSYPTDLLASRPNRKAKMRSRIQAGQRKRGQRGKRRFKGFFEGHAYIGLKRDVPVTAGRKELAAPGAGGNGRRGKPAGCKGDAGRALVSWKTTQRLREGQRRGATRRDQLVGGVEGFHALKRASIIIIILNLPSMCDQRCYYSARGGVCLETAGRKIVVRWCDGAAAVVGRWWEIGGCGENETEGVLEETRS